MQNSVSVSPDPDLIFDLGMNICEDTAFYLAKGFRVVAVEADPFLCEQALEKHREAVDSGRLQVVNRAVSESDEPLIFYRCLTMSAWSTASESLRDHWQRRGAEFEEIRVPAITPRALLEAHGTPHFAKIDIEGFDLLFLDGLAESGARPDFVSAEVDFRTYRQMIKTMRSIGYDRFALVGQSSVPLQKARASGSEGKAIDYQFALGCSGNFGDDLAEPWVDWRTLSKQCRAIVWQHRLVAVLNRLASAVPPLARLGDRLSAKWLPLSRDWYDIHARKSA